MTEAIGLIVVGLVALVIGGELLVQCACQSELGKHQPDRSSWCIASTES